MPVDKEKEINIYCFAMKLFNSGYKRLNEAICLAMICTFGVSLFAAAVMAQEDCGLNCCCQSKPMPQHHAPQEQIRSPMGCCAGSAQMPCDVENSTESRYPDLTIASANGHGIHTVGPASGPASAMIDRYDLRGHVFDYSAREKFRTTPLYLQNRSFLI